MAAVGRDKELVRLRTRHDQFPVGQRAWFDRTVDANLKRAVAEIIALVLTETKTPSLTIVRGLVWNCVRTFRKRVKMWFQFTSVHRSFYRDAISDHVQATFLEIDQAFSSSILDVSITDVPFVGNGPIQDRRATGNFLDGEW